MIIIERKYKIVDSRSYANEAVERKVFKDNDFTPIQEFINKEGEFRYVKL